MQTNNTNVTEFHWMTVLLQNMDVGIVVLNQNYEVQIWNTFMENHSGIQPQEIRNNNLFDFFPEIPKEWFKRKCEAVFLLQNQAFSTWQQRPYLFEFDNYRPITSTENHMYQNFTILPITSLTGETESIAIVIHDVTDIAHSKKELERSNKSLTMQSRTDQLTQLNNRWYWELRLEQEFTRFKRYGNKNSLLMLDIDHFKKVNDTYGHPAGDEVIRQLARSIFQIKRDSDIAGRYGGEEFGILLTDTDADSALIFANRLRELIESNIIVYENKNIAVTISLGITEFDDTVEEHETLISQADEALYASKNNGRNQATIYRNPNLVDVSIKTSHSL